jgi:hypothetical protein
LPEGLSHPSFYKVAVNRSLEISPGSRKQYLMKRMVSLRIVHDKNFERKKIKRGTLGKEFLYKLFFIKSFFLAKLHGQDFRIEGLTG